METNKDKLFIVDAFFKRNFDRLLEWSVGDIRKCCRMRKDGSCEEDGAMVGSFILWICSIEYLGGLLSGNTEMKGTSDRITRFIQKYLKGYNPEYLIELRWSLLHYYSPHYFALIHENNLNGMRRYHLQKIPGKSDQYYLHLGCSVFDLEKAVEEFKKDFWNKKDQRIIAYNFYKTHLPIMPINFTSLVLNDSLANSNPSIVRVDMAAFGTTNKW